MSAAPDLIPAITLAAAFAAGLAGSAHCFGMCGGIAGSYGMKARQDAGVEPGSAAARAFRQVALHHLGRMTGYAVLGGAIGAAGGLLFGILDLARLAGPLRFLTGLVIVALGLRLLFRLRGLGLVERGGAHLWRYLAPLTRRLIGRQGPAAAFGMGLLWGWLPCGLVYSMLVMAATTGTATTGAATMLAFGAGTLPAMLSSGLMASQLARVLRLPAIRPLAGALLIVCGIWTLAAAVGGGHSPVAESDPAAMHGGHAGH